MKQITYTRRTQCNGKLIIRKSRLARLAPKHTDVK
jgi:hypothetical protein